jgi:hypothetical protein
VGWKKPQGIRALRLRAGVQKSIAYECTSPRFLQTCIGEPRARIKIAVPSKEQQLCCDTDTSFAIKAARA